MHCRRLCVLVVCVLAISAGCSKTDDGRMEVSGTVTLKGQPLASGVIQFQPIDPGLNASAGGGVISAGAYSIPKTSGLIPGRYKVLISAADGQTPTNPDQPPGPSGNFVSKELIPPEFNEASKQEVQVKDGLNVVNFEIP